jgi:hypothetical protein
MVVAGDVDVIAPARRCAAAVAPFVDIALVMNENEMILERRRLACCLLDIEVELEQSVSCTTRNALASGTHVIGWAKAGMQVGQVPIAS